ncbi:hypothetical protein ccbrp13_11310 [Ktedonobacteria bacterium brp13]|nr:hypothetical protein ccbrp13_11310 [Ktedonobacteria bacterium brp13]
MSLFQGKDLKKLIDNKKINRDWSLVGTPEQIVEQLRPFINLGFDYFIVGADDFLI